MQHSRIPLANLVSHNKVRPISSVLKLGKPRLQIHLCTLTENQVALDPISAGSFLMGQKGGKKCSVSFPEQVTLPWGICVIFK